MTKLTVDFSEIKGKIKPMHSVNNGPVGGTWGVGNIELFREAGIPYARNHDAAFASAYGGEHAVDVSNIFPDFDADETKEENYDFVLTDVTVKKCMEAGTKVFYRLGQKIEHAIKKYGVNPPEDFKKWAVICEHIIRHYTDVWANGFDAGIEYWEIWNEHDNGEPDKNPCWTGTVEQFHDFYEIVAKHLKEKFPHLKIGGPAMVGSTPNYKKAEEFVSEMAKRNVPLDFFSYHFYTTSAHGMSWTANYTRELLDSYGYTDTEIILDEWNYCTGWDRENMTHSYKTIRSLRGAAYVSACQIDAQKSPIDMFMYYDARPGTGFNGMFELGTYEPMKPYYSFLAFNELYKLGGETKSESDDNDVYVLSAKGDKKAVLISYYGAVEAEDKVIELHLTGFDKPNNKVSYRMLDNGYDLELTKDEYINGEAVTLYIKMEANTVMLLTIE